MAGLHPEAGYMTASVPKRVGPLASPLTARAGPYMYLLAADKYSRPLASRLIGIEQPVILGFQALIPPHCPASGRTSAASFHAHRAAPFLKPSAAGATAAPETSTLLATTRRDRSIPSPLLVSAAATPWLSHRHSWE